MAIYRKGESEKELRRAAFFVGRNHEDSDEGRSYSLGRHNKSIDSVDFGVSGDDLARGNDDRPAGEDFNKTYEAWKKAGDPFRKKA